MFSFAAAEEELNFGGEFFVGEDVAGWDALFAALFFFAGTVGQSAGFAGGFVGALVASVGC